MIDKNAIRLNTQDTTLYEQDWSNKFLAIKRPLAVRRNLSTDQKVLFF